MHSVRARASLSALYSSHRYGCRNPYPFSPVSPGLFRGLARSRALDGQAVHVGGLPRPRFAPSQPSGVWRSRWPGGGDFWLGDLYGSFGSAFGDHCGSGICCPRKPGEAGAAFRRGKADRSRRSWSSRHGPGSDCLHNHFGLLDRSFRERSTLSVLPIGLGALTGAIAIIASSLAITRPPRLQELAADVTIAEQPRLWAMVLDIATRLKTSPPKNVILSMKPGFYATAFELNVQNRAEPVQGETLACLCRLCVS